MDIRILIAAHKPYGFAQDDIYMPVQVGAALNDKFGAACDDTGDNISDKNPYYCELTGLYWMWKNVKADYCGLVHYRRYFAVRGCRRLFGRNKYDAIAGRKDIEKLLADCDIILPSKRHYYIESLYSHYAHTHYGEHLDITRDIIHDKYPEYIESYDKVMKQRSGHMFNMMIMSRDKLDAYCTWLFDILGELEKRVDYKGYDTFQARLFGRVSELLLNVWVVHGGYRYRTLPTVSTERMAWGRKIKSFITAKFSGRKYDKSF